MKARRGALVSALVLVPGSFLAAAAPSAPRFVDVAAESGLEFRHWNGLAGQLYISEIFGPGVAFFDGDGDGDLDVLALEGALLDPAGDVPLEPPPADRRARYFRNELIPSGRLRFADGTAESGLRIDGYAMGIATGDVDGDGGVDLYVSHLGRGQLWRNAGPGRFENVSAAAGLLEAVELERAGQLWGTSASFFDADADGDLDLFVAHYLAYGKSRHKTCAGPGSAPDYCGPASFEPIADHFFRNRGDGTFEEATLAAGFGTADGPGLGTVITDFDLDGQIDLYVANDGTENQLWRSRGDGTFEDVAPLVGAAVDGNGQPEAGMGVDSGDVDGDGDEDLIAVHFDPETKTLYRNSGDGFYEDATLAAGLNQKGFTSFGAGFFDFDLDGDLDLFAVNGAIHLLPDQVAAGSPLPLAQRKQFFENEGRGRFREILPAEEPVVGLEEVSRGLAFGDVDNDGDPDLLIGNNDGPLRLLRNDAPRAGRWLGLEVLLEGKQGRRAALGARVIVEAGGKRLVRRVQTDGSYLSARDPRLQIGLPPGMPPPILVRVEWPDRAPGQPSAERWQIADLDRYHRLVRGQGQPSVSPLTKTLPSGPENGLHPSGGPGGEPPFKGISPLSVCGEGGRGERSESCSQPAPIAWEASLAGLEERVRQQLAAARSQAEGDGAAASWESLAELSHAYGLPQTADFYRRAQTLDPRLFRSFYLAGVFALEKGRLEEADAFLAAAAPLDPGQRLVAYRQAQVAFAREDFAATRVRLAPALADPRLAAAAHELAAQAATHLGDLAGAARHYDQALELAPQASRLRAAAGALHLRLGDRAKAAALLAERGEVAVAVDDPFLRELETRLQSAQRFQEIGEEELRAGRPEAAVEAFRRAALLEPANLGARANLGTALAAAARPQEARAVLEAVLAEDPRHARALLQLASLCAGGDEERAIELLRRLLDSEPEQRQALINLGNLLRRRGEPAAAAGLYARAVLLAGGDAELRLGLVRTWVEAGRDEEALAAAEAAHRDLPQEPLLQNALARLLAGSRVLAARDGARALELARRAFAASPTLPVVETLAMASAQLGKFAEALGWQRQAIEAARAAGRLEANPHLEANAERYRKGLAAASPWPPVQ